MRRIVSYDIMIQATGWHSLREGSSPAAAGRRILAEADSPGLAGYSSDRSQHRTGWVGNAT